MKRKNFYSVLIAILALLFGAGGGVAWGQLYSTDIPSASQTNNAFGAGESSYITPNHTTRSAKNPWNLQTATGGTFSWFKDHRKTLPSPYAGFSTGVYTNPLASSNDIVLGGTMAENIVIRAYTGNGYALGWISVLNKVAPTCTNDVIPDYNSYENNFPIQARYTQPTTFYRSPNREVYEFSFNKFNYDNYGVTPWPATPTPISQGTADPKWLNKAPCGWGLFQAKYPDPTNRPFYFEISTHILLNQFSVSGISTIARPWAVPNIRSAEAFPSDIPYGLYTSTVNAAYSKEWLGGYFNGGSPLSLADKTITKYPIDDGIPLVQFSGSNMTDGNALDQQKNHRLESNAGYPIGTLNPDATTASQWGDMNETQNTVYLSNYRRPTTIVLQHGNVNSHLPNQTFSRIVFNDIRWKYNLDTVKADYKRPTIGYLSDCCSGICFAFEFEVDWKAKTYDGATLVDGAIVLQPNAWVCVEEDVKDATSYPGSKQQTATPGAPDAKTDAILVFPNQATEGRFTLRVKGNIDHVNMAQGDTRDPNPMVTPNPIFYTQQNFPQPNRDIFLYRDTVTANAHLFNTPHLGGFQNNNPNAFITNHPIVAPTDKAKGSIFGVFGNYLPEGDTSHIHTDITPPNFASKNPGVIELGPEGLGRGHLHVYSGGTVKNFESCTNIPNFSLNFGGGFGTPDIKITADTTLFIMNYGNDDGDGCNAHIIFHDIVNDTVSNAINGLPAHYGSVPQGTGPFRIQALSNVEFRKDETWTTGTTGKNNNLLILSDAGNVISQKITYDGGNAGNVAEGLLTFWAEDHNGRPGLTFGTNCSPNNASNRNSLRGNIYMNDNVDIKRLNNAGTTETNVIAANNVRTATFKFESDNQDKDTTNIISRKGDLYLGYSLDAPRHSGSPASTGYTFNQNIFDYKVNSLANKGVLNIKAGYDDAQAEMTKAQGMEGGNIYFTQIKTNMAQHGEYPTNITIPYSSEYICNARTHNESLHNRDKSYQAYEHSGIIGGVGACGEDHEWGHYGGLLMDARTPTDKFVQKSLIYKGNNADLTVDAGRRGNIIMNTGTSLDYDGDKGNAIFRTRDGDIDMRDKTDVTRMNGNLLFLAQLENLGDLSKIGVCGCDEERNNVYLQDFELQAGGDNGSVFIGADNNIKLNYGGLTNIGTRQDPFLSKAYEEKDGRVLKVGRGYNPNVADHCGTYFHCDLDGTENRASDFLLNFSTANSGGFAAVASDMIDVYKDLIYNGGNGTGMGSVPGTGTLHGESVSGYGLFMKTQGNKKNWTANVFHNIPKCPTDCSPTGCDNLKPGEEATGFLHNTVRMTFHGEAHFHAENQRVHLESPVIESFGAIEFDAFSNGGSNGQITVKTDSLICHDSMIISGGNKVKLSSWSGLPNDQPIIKLGYSRKAAPFEEWAEENKRCRECVSHYKGKVYAKGETPLDTMFVKFGPTTELRRQNVMVIDHTVLSFLTDSFDHVKGGEVLNARYFVDTLKIRNQVEFWTDKMHERDGHLELISEQQMLSKDYAGMYTRHLHLEPIGACGRPGSELWLPGLALDVITYSTFGGFGTQYTDVHVENQANLNPGFTSLRLRGQCFEQRCGTLTMKDLRLDGGSNLNISVGTKKGLNGEFSDAVDVDMLTTYGPVNVNLEIRPCERIEKRCYPIIYYKSVSPNSLNALKLNPSTIKIDGDEYPLNLNISTDGVVYVCVGDAHAPGLSHTVTMPETAGVKTTPGKGIWSVPARGNFRFSATYSGQKPLVVRTNRMFNGQQEVLAGILNSNGEYEYIVPGIQQEVTLTFGPDAVANELLKGTAVWSHGEMIYIRVDRADIASIYSVAGQLVKRVDLPEGDTSIPMSRGAYVITLKDGSVHKVIVK